jgi:hypothetical protein
VGCLRRWSSSGVDQAKGVPACFVSVRAAAKQRRLRAKGCVSAFAPTIVIRGHHIPAAIMDHKLNEFLALSEGNHTMLQYA